VTESSHLSGSNVDPEGPRFRLSSNMTATDRTFYTTVEPGIRFHVPYRLVIDHGLAHAEALTAQAVGLVGDEIEWEVLERGN
jgi:hypothetical protein